eukprot:TRINITY_DN988_c0_g1_i2.p1 TRINITY_DN988_c0_g1~~TRINITY_DN988_c0_g1_i2.p1  ORF type:complete len:376 (-),score=64.71 TRINITY_DN988_c0_g1_i2:17-1144(-)
MFCRDAPSEEALRLMVREKRGFDGIYKTNRYGRYNCDSPKGLVDSALIASNMNEPDFVVVTGDLAGHVLSRDHVIEALKYSVSKIKETYKMPMIFSLGNDDFYPNYSRNVTMKDWLTVLYPIYETLLPSEQAKHTFAYGGYFSHQIGSLTIVSLNSVLYSPNFMPEITDDPLGQFSWLEGVLQSSNRVYIIGHMPPASIVWNHENQWRGEYITKYFDLISKYQHKIAGQLYGHTHRDDFKIYSKDDKVTFSLLLSPSISPNSFTNPSFRYYIYNRSDYSLIDYINYYLDLLLVNQSGPEWKVEYDYSTAYDEEDLSPGSLAKLYNKMENDADLFSNWFKRYSVLYNSERLQYLCAIRYPNTEEYAKCIEEVTPQK